MWGGLPHPRSCLILSVYLFLLFLLLLLLMTITGVVKPHIDDNVKFHPNMNTFIQFGDFIQSLTGVVTIDSHAFASIPFFFFVN